MKLLLKGNSLELCLNHQDVERTRETGRVESSVWFGPNSRLVYALEVVEDGESICADLQDSAITVYMPAGLLETWLATEDDQFGTTQSIDGDQELLICLGKDELRGNLDELEFTGPPRALAS